MGGCIRGYLSFVERCRYGILIFWLGILIWGIVDGRQFIRMAQDAVPVTPGTEAAKAQAALETHFTGLAHEVPWILFLRCEKGLTCPSPDKQSIDSEATKQLILELESTLQEGTKGVFTMFVNYYTFNGTLVDDLKLELINPSQDAMFTLWTASITASQYDRFDAHSLLKSKMYAARDSYCPGCFIGITGLDSLGDDALDNIVTNLIKADLITIPIAICILAYMVGTWRYLIVTLFNLATTIFTSFAVMVYVSKATVNPQSVTPQFVEVMAIALCIDYSLFFFTRFVDELTKKRKKWRLKRYLLRSTVAGGSSSESYNNSSSNSNSNSNSHSHVWRPPHHFSGTTAGLSMSNYGTYGSVMAGGSESSRLRAPGTPPSDDVSTSNNNHNNNNINNNIEWDEGDEYLTISENPLNDIVKASLYSTISNSGHVIVVSGSTLLLSFCGFFISQCDFLYMPAVSNIIMIVICVAVCMTATPAFILAFPTYFTDFNPLCTFCYKRCPRRRRPMLGDMDATGDEIEAEVDDDDVDVFEVNDRSSRDIDLGRPSRDMVLPHSFSAPARADPHEVYAATTDQRRRKEQRERARLAHEQDQIYNPRESGVNKDIKKMRKSNWYKLGSCLVKWPTNLIVMLILLGLTGAVAWKLFFIELSTSFDMGIPRSAPSMLTLKALSASFSPGLIQPFYYILVKPQDVSSILTDEYFDAGITIYKSLLDETTLNHWNIKSVFYYNNTYIDRSKAEILLDEDPIYQVMWYKMAAVNMEATLFTIHVPFNPETDMSRWFVGQARSKTKASGVDFTRYEGYLCGYKVTEADTVEFTTSRFPTMIVATTAAVVVACAILLKSAFVPVRLLLTLIVPMAAVYGIAILVYQDGMLNWLGVSAVSNDLGGFYWDIPIFSFVVLLGLALDYDIFIISRIIEHRVNAYTNGAAITLALYETGPVITAAGLIMAISFCSLLIMEAAAVQQTGFILVTAVLLDTFVVRSLIVPCVMSFADKIGWWPRDVPTTNLKDAEGSTAIIEHNSAVVTSGRVF